MFPSPTPDPEKASWLLRGHSSADRGCRLYGLPIIQRNGLKPFDNLERYNVR